MSILPALAGGLLIGSAAVLLYAGAGRIAGISGIAYSTLWSPDDGRGWRLSFIAALLAGAWLAHAGGFTIGTPPAFDGLHATLYAVAGLLTGVGTRLGGGCTSGHGICGMARLSPRSLVATLCFMATGMLVATLLRPLLLS